MLSCQDTLTRSSIFESVTSIIFHSWGRRCQMVLIITRICIIYFEIHGRSHVRGIKSSSNPNSSIDLVRICAMSRYWQLFFRFFHYHYRTKNWKYYVLYFRSVLHIDLKDNLRANEDEGSIMKLVPIPVSSGSQPQTEKCQLRSHTFKNNLSFRLRKENLKFNFM